MKTKNILLVGSVALILYLLMKQKKNTNFQSNLTNSDTNSGGASASSPILPSQNTSNEPEQVYGLNLPSTMDLPVLTPSTGVPTEVAVQQGGVDTTLTPAIVIPRPLPTTDVVSAINVIPRETQTVNSSVSIPSSNTASVSLPSNDTVNPAIQPRPRAEIIDLPEIEPTGTGILTGNPRMVSSLPNLNTNTMLNANGKQKGKIIKAKLYRGVM